MAGFKRCRCVRIGHVGRLRAQYVQGRRFGVRMGMQFAPGSRIRRACANLAVGGEYRHVEADMRVFNGDILSHLICAGRLLHRSDLIVGHGLQRCRKQA